MTKRFPQRLAWGCAAIAAATTLLLSPASRGGDAPNATAIPKDTGAYATRFLRDQGDIAIMEFSGNYDRKLPDGSQNLAPRAAVAREFFGRHPDVYDMLVVFTQFPIDTGDYFAFYHSAQNRVTGIGRPVFDNTPQYGSNGKLLGMIDMADLGRHHPNSLNRDFDFSLGAFAHEFLHQFGAYVRYRKPDGTIASDLLGKDGAHWSYLLDSGASLLYGSKWRDNGDGTFTATAVTDFYSPLDLYLMGFRKKEDVPPFSLIDAPGVDPNQLPLLNATVQGTRRQVTVDDVIAAEGPRVPDVSGAQKEFRLAFVYLVRPGEAVTDAEVAALGGIRRAIGTRFSALTGGVANINVFAEPLTTAAPGAPPGLPPPTSPPATNINLPLAVQWLKDRQSLADASWADTPPTAIRDSAIAAATLQELDPGYGRILEAAAWLDARSTASVDFLARKLSTLSLVNRSPVGSRAVELLAAQNADGGWGAAQGYASNPLDTALAAQALLRRAEPVDASTSRAFGYLRAAQNPDGGWGNFAGGTSRTSTTAQVIVALGADAAAEAALAAGKAFMATRQNADGGFGDSPSSVHDTAHVVAALMAANATSQIRLDAAMQYLSVNQRVNGSWNDSVYSTALALNVLARANAMNWAVTAFTASPTRTTDGQRVAYTVAVKNTGNRSTPAGKLRLFDGDPAAGGTPIGADGDIPVLVPGATASVTLHWNTLGKAGVHEMRAVVDPDRTAQELSTADNVATLTYTVDPALSLADFLVAPADITMDPAAPTQIPSTLTVSALLTNAGLAAGENVPVVLWEGSGASRTRVAETVIASFAPRSTRPVTFQAVVSRAGATSFTVEIDPDKAITESDEANNAATVTVTTGTEIDLDVRATDIARDKPNPRQGEDVAFTVTLRNRGTVATPDFAVRYAIRVGSDTTTLATNTIRLGAGEQATQTVPWRANATGSVTFVVELDPAGAVSESDRANNVAEMAFTVSSDAGPSLAVSFRDIVVAPSPALEGSPLAISAVVRNLGSEAAAPVEVAFFIGDPAAGGVPVGEIQTLASLAAGAAQQVAVQWANVPDASTKLVYVVVDPAGRVAGDVVREDNKAFITVPVRSLPDLAVATGNLSLVPALPRPGDAVTLAVRVDNQGQQPATGVLVRVFDGDPAAGGVPVGGDQVIASIAPSESATATFQWNFPSQAGDRVLFVQVDPLQAVPERNRANNMAQLAVGVQSGDFTASQRHFSPDGDGVQDSVDFTFRLQSARSVTIRVVDGGGSVVRTHASPEYANTATGRWTWDGRNDTGSVVRDGAYAIQALDSSQNLLGEARVILDTNRSSLIEALGTPYALRSNLACQIPNRDIDFPKAVQDGSKAYFLIRPSTYPQPGELPHGVYQVNGTGSDLRQVIAAPAATRTYWIQMLPSRDGSRLAVLRYNELNYEASLWIASGEGGELRQLAPGYLEPIAFSADALEVIVRDSSLNELRAVSIANGASRLIAGDVAYGESSLFSPDRRAMLINSSPDVRIVDVATGSSRTLANVSFYGLSWAPDSRAFASGDRNAGTIVVYGEDGTVRRSIVVEGPGALQQFVWGEDSSELFFSTAGDWCPSEAECTIEPVIRRLGIASGEVREILRQAVRIWDGEGYLPNRLMMSRVPGQGQFVVRDGHGWDDSGDRWVLLSSSAPYATSAISAADPVLRHMPPGFDLLEPDPDRGWQGFAEFGRAFRYQGESEGPTCASGSNWGPLVLRSLQNLTADLRAVRTTSAVKLIGTAADANFARYSLEYARAETPEAWQPIAPVSTVPVLDGEMAAWAPPGIGSYLVRLTVEDLAGNRRQVVKRVGWGASTVVTDVYRSPEFISPNGDGIQDASRLNYRVLEPVNLEFRVANSRGETVRSFTRSHPASGVEATLDWDGRNDAGALVADGTYTLSVLDFALSIKVDNAPPAPAPAAQEMPWSMRPTNRISRIDLMLMPVSQDPWNLPVPEGRNEPHVRIDWAVADANFSAVRVQREDASQPGEWMPLFESNRANVWNPYDPLLVPLELAGRSRYRVIASDLAGNTTSEILQLDELVEVANVATNDFEGAPVNGAIESEDLSAGIFLEVVETVRAPIAQLAIEYQGPLADGEPLRAVWSQRILPLPDQPPVSVVPQQTSTEGAFRTQWDAAEITGSGRHAFRVRITDPSGGVFHSSPITFTKEPKFLIQDAFLEASSRLTVVAYEKLGRLVERIDLLVKSPNDPAYVAERVAWTRPGASTVAGLGDFFLVVDDRFVTCTSYELRLRATVAGATEPVFSNSKKVQACTFVETTVKPVEADACDALPPGRLRVALKTVSEISVGVPLALLEFGRRRPDGTDDVLFSKVNPAFGTPYAFVFDTGGLAEGEHAAASGGFFARVTDIQGAKKQEGVRIVVDRTPLAARITNPVAGQRLCARQGTDAAGQPFSYLDVEGSLADALGFDYVVQTTAGEPTGSWADVPVVSPQCGPDSNRGRPVGDITIPVGNSETFKPNEANNCGGFTALTGKEFAGTIARLRNVTGTRSVRIKGRDWGGYQACPTVTFYVDGGVESGGATVDRTAFAPGRPDELGAVTLTYRADEPLKVTATVWRREDVTLLPSGQLASIAAGAVPVRRLADAATVSAGNGTLTWNGSDDAGAPVADGSYALVVSYLDDCGNRLAEKPFLLFADRTPPTVAIASPAADSEVSAHVEVTGRVDDLSLASYTLEAGAGPDPQAWAPVRTDTRTIDGGLLGTWNTLGLAPGTYTLRLRATDHVGNTAETRVTVTVRESGALISYLEGAPPIFSPNNDGRLDELALRYAFNVPVTVKLTVLRGAEVVRTLVDNASAPAGAATATWDGRTGAGQAAADGPYTVELVATAGSSTETVAITVGVDTVSPTSAFPGIAGGFATGTSSIVGTVEDANLAGYTVTLQGVDTGTNVTLDQGSAPRAGYDFGALAGLPEGRYSLVVTANDRAENRTTLAFAFEIDNTPPRVTLTAPLAGTVIGPKASPFGVTGTIDERNLKLFTLNLGQGPPPGGVELASGTVLPPPPIHALDVSRFADGSYTLRLTASDQAGWSATAAADIVIDKTAPVAAIASPAEGGYLKLNGEIKGAATDANFRSLRLEIAPGARATASRFTEFASAATPVEAGGILGRVAALPPDGVHTVRLTVADKADNLSSALVEVKVDTTPPVAPAGLATRVENRQDVTLTWNAVADAALAGYLVYRDGTRITPNPVTATTLADVGVPEGDHAYTVSAVDEAGNEGPRSAPATARISLSTPTAQITSPARNALVGGVVEVRGSAYAPRDFKEFRLSVGQGTAPASFALLRRSTVAAQGELLAQWNTLALPEGAAYTIQLEAEDTFGAVGRDSLVVTVDNLPPAKPLNLQATVAASDVTLTWAPNLEADLDGYLLYRGERLVNQAGPVVGDLRPYLLRETTYVDRAVADGTYAYTVVAVDKAGNPSEPSAPRSVTVDTRAPKATVVKPAAGATVDRSTYVLAASDDNDIASIQLQYRPSGGAWANLGAALTAAPFGLDWDLSSLPYGGYDLRAVAIDTTGKTDPSPAFISVTRARLQRPDMPTGLTARVTGESVALSWTAVSSPDLAGYHVDRVDPDGNSVRLTGAPVGATAYVDVVDADGRYGYRVASVDTAGTESDPSAEAAALVHSLEVVQPYTPTDVRTVTLTGKGLPGLGVTLTITVAGNDRTLQQAADGQGRFSFGPLTLETGDNRFALVQVDAAGNSSRIATPHVLVADRPAKPTGLVATATDLDVQLAWNPNTESDLAGYFATIDGYPETESLTPTAALSSSQYEWAPAGGAVDGDPNTAWQPADEDRAPWLEVELGERRLVPWISVSWGPGGDPWYAPRHFAIDGWDGETWVPLAEVASNTEGGNSLELAQPYLTDRLRIRVLGFGESGFVSVSDVLVEGILTTTSTARLVSAWNSGEFRFAVRAHNAAGLASEPSDAASLTVGDVVPPEPVTLQATVNGRDVSLAWTASASADVVGYEIFRNGSLVASTFDPPQLAAVDAGLAYGIYTYQVHAVDNWGNYSAPSNAVTVSITASTLGRPLNLTVAPVGTGGALDLAWSAPADGTTPAAYGVMRAVQAGGPYQTVTESVTGTSYRDTGLSNGTRFFYRVYARNASNESGPLSDEASGVPQVTVAPEPPRLSFPASPQQPATLTVAAASVSGFAVPGANVSLFDNGLAAGTVTAIVANQYFGIDGNEARLSPDGAWAFAGRNGNAELLRVDFDSLENTVTTARVYTGVDPQAVSWSRNGRRVAFVVEEWDAAQGRWLFRPSYLDLDELVVRRIASLDAEAARLVISPDGAQAYTVASRDGRRGLWRIELASGTATPVLDVTGTIAGLALAPSGQALAYTAGGTLQVLDLGTGALRPQTVANAADPSWSPASDAVAFTAPTGTKRDVYVLDFTGSAPRAVTQGATSPRTPAWSPDGTRIAYHDNSEVWIVAVSAGAPDRTWLGYSLGLNWVASGYLASTSWGGISVLRPAGHFRVPDVLFAIGENRLTAVASLEGSPASAQSSPAIVTYSTADRPDLAVSVADITVIPGVPGVGETTRVTVQVRNTGPRASAPASFLLQAIDPERATQTLVDARVPAIAPGGSEPVVVDWKPGKAGRHQLSASIDRLGEVAEVSEANNVAVRDVTVVDSSVPRVEVFTEAGVYPQNAAVAIEARVINGGNTFSGTLEILVEDAQGFLVAALAPQSVSSLAFGQTATAARTWNTGTTLPGRYRIRVALRDASGAEVGTALAPFTIDAPVDATATVATDRGQYAPADTVRITGRVTFQSAGGAGLAGEATIRVLDAAGQVRFEMARPLAFGTTADVLADWAIPAQAAGSYTVRLEVRFEGRTIASAGATFNVVAASLLPPVVSIVSPSADAVFAAPARVVVTAGASSPNAGGSIAKVELFQGSTLLGTATAPPYVIEWSGVAAGEYLLVARATDNRGAQADSSAVRIVVNAVPTVAITSPAANASFDEPANIAIVAAAQDADGTIARIEILQGALKLGECAAASCTVDWNAVPAGGYVLTAVAVDNRGGRTTSVPVPIVVSGAQQPPTVSLTSPADGAVANAPATFTLSATAASPNAGGSIARVEFYAGATKIGEATTAPYTVPWTQVGAGSYAIRARAIDNRGVASDSAAANVIVNAPPAVQVVAPPDGAVVAAPATIAITAAASDADGTIARVEFFSGATKIGEALSAPYTLTWPAVPSGTYLLTARATDDRGASADSAPITVIVNALPTVAITTPAANASFTEPATIAVSAAAQDADGTIATIEILNGANRLALCPAAPTCAFEWSAVAAGSYALTARATDDRGAVATSAPVNVTVLPAPLPPTVALTSPAAGTVVNAPGAITLAASASSPNAGGSIAKVEFFSGVTKVGEALAAPYTYNWTAVPAGTYSVTARATDNRGATTDSAAVTVVVNALPTVSLTSPAAGATFPEPASITVAASAQDSDGSIARIELFNGTTRLAECPATATCSFAWNAVAAGTYVLTAKATDDRGGTATSVPVSVTVEAAAQPPTVALTSPAGGTVVDAPGPVVLAATASSPNAGGTIAKVEFFAGSTKLGEATSAPYTYTWTGVAAGPYSLTARATDNRGVSTDSAAVSLVVNALPSATITSPAANASFLAPAEIAVTASAQDADGTVSKIEVFQGATKLGECAATPCTVTWSAVGAGAWSLTAKATDDRGAVGTSPAVGITVGALGGTIGLTPATAAVGQRVVVAAQVTSPVALAALPLKVRVYDPSAGTTLTQWTTTANVAGGEPFSWAFDWDTTGQPPGTYKAALSESRSGTDVTLAETSVVLTAASSVRLEPSLGESARVLVLATCYQSSGTTDTVDLACAEARKAEIGQMLAGQGVPHLVLTDADRFRDEMRCGSWNVFWISGGREKLKDRMAEELAEQVYAGKGLLVDGVYDAAAASLDPVLGVTFRAKLDLSRNYGVTPADSLLVPGSFQTAGRANRLEALPGATVHARFDTAGSDPAVVSSPYGAGRAMALGFDLARTALAQPPVQANLVPILEAIAPAAREPDRPIVARLVVTNTGAAGTVTVSAALPAGLSLASSSPGASAGPSWSLPMAAGEERVIVLQFTATGGEGSYTVPFTSGSVTETLAIDVAPLSGGTHAAVVQALNGLSLSGAEATARNAAVALVNQSSSTLASYPEGALYYLLDARKEVAKIANAGGADEQLARLHVATGSSTCQQMAACLRPGSGTQPAFGSYHVLVFGSASISNGSVEGSLGIGGSASLSSEGIATRWMGDAARLIVGGSVSYSSGSVGINGTGIIRASGTLTLTPSVGRRSATGSVPTENWSALATYYRDLSTRLGALPGIAAVSGPTGTYTLRGTDPARNVFTLTAAQATATRTLVFDVPLTSSVIVNVTGGAASFANGQQFVMVGGTQTPMSQHEFASRVLYNFPQASALGASSWSFQGTVLAPRASLSYANSNLFGQLIINTLSSSGVGFQQCGAYVGTLP